MPRKKSARKSARRASKRKSVSRKTSRASKSKTKKKFPLTGGQVFVGFMFLGIGAGFLLNNVSAGVMFGIGIGFLAKWYLER